MKFRSLLPGVVTTGQGLKIVFDSENLIMKGIAKNKHGFADYSYVPLVLAAPQLAGFDDDYEGVTITRAFAGVVLGYSLLTDAKWGVIKLIPYKVHAVLDLTAGVAAAAAPWVFAVSQKKKVRNTLLLMGLTGISVGILSIIGASRK